jgi:hypothetical protein
MKWFDPAAHLPADGEEVIVRCKWLFYVATYYSSENVFKIRRGTSMVAVEGVDLWAKLVKP